MTRRAAVVYDCLFPLSLGGGERLYRRVAELLVERGFSTDYVTRTAWDELPVTTFRLVGLRPGEIYNARGVRTTLGAVIFALGVWRYFIRHRNEYDVIIASALPVLTAIAVRVAVVGSRTRVVADWLEVWPAKKWRAYSGTVSGSVAYLLQSLAARMIREHTVDSRFTADRLLLYRPRRPPVVLGLMDLVESGTPRLPATPPFVFFVGRLIADKGADTIPAALALARRDIPGLRAVIVGDGPERSRILEAVTASGLGAVIELTGRVSDERLDEIRATAVALVAPSIREGFGLAVAEASAWGVPAVVVAHEDNAAVDLIEEGINGFVVAPGDPAALAAGIVEAVRGGPTLRRSTVEWFARARVERGLSASLDVLLDGTAR
ncbi:MAG: glycosyltransferase family 4 protein [Actinomycetota bacterium]|nr:glycosyltransferase family 4 protein [Actinomycetota bacterium]